MGKLITGQQAALASLLTNKMGKPVLVMEDDIIFIWEGSLLNCTQNIYQTNNDDNELRALCENLNVEYFVYTK